MALKKIGNLIHLLPRRMIQTKLQKFSDIHEMVIYRVVKIKQVNAYLNQKTITEISVI